MEYITIISAIAIGLFWIVVNWPIRQKWGKERVQYIFYLENNMEVRTPYKAFDQEEANELFNIVKNPTETTHITLTDNKDRICILPYDVLVKCVFTMHVKTFLF